MFLWTTVVQILLKDQEVQVMGWVSGAKTAIYNWLVVVAVK